MFTSQTYNELYLIVTLEMYTINTEAKIEIIHYMLSI